MTTATAAAGLLRRLLGCCGCPAGLLLLLLALRLGRMLTLTRSLCGACAVAATVLSAFLFFVSCVWLHFSVIIALLAAGDGASPKAVGLYRSTCLVRGWAVDALGSPVPRLVWVALGMVCLAPFKCRHCQVAAAPTGSTAHQTAALQHCLVRPHAAASQSEPR